MVIAGSILVIATAVAGIYIRPFQGRASGGRTPAMPTASSAPASSPRCSGLADSWWATSSPGGSPSRFLNLDLESDSFERSSRCIPRGHFRIRRQCADRQFILRGAAHEPREACRAVVALVRVLGLPAVYRARGHRLPARRHPMEYAEPEWYVDLWLTLDLVVYFLVFVGTFAPARAAHLRGQLVLSRFHRHHCHAAYHQQSGDPRSLLARRAMCCSACRTP